MNKGAGSGSSSSGGSSGYTDREKKAKDDEV